MSASQLLERLHRAGAMVGWDGRPLLRAPAGTLEAGLVGQARADLPAISVLLAELAQRLGAQQVCTAPLSREQQRLWFVATADGDDRAQLIELTLRFRPGRSAPPTAEAMEALQRRHPMLAALFVPGHEEPMMCFPTPAGRLAARVVDLRNLHDDVAAAALPAILREHARRSFALHQTPGWRCLHVLEPDGAIVVQFVRHHLCSDGWSLGLILRDLVVLAATLRAGRPLPEPASTAIVYAEHACRQRLETPPQGGETLRELHGRRLRMLPTSDARGRPRTLRRTTDGRGIAEFARAHRLTSFCVGCGLFAVALGHLLGRRDVAFGIDVSTRREARHDLCVGTFVNRAVLVLDVPDDGPADEFFVHVAGQVRRASEGGGVPFERLVHELAPERGDTREALIDVLFGLHAEPRHAPYRALGQVELLHLDDGATHLPLSMYLTVDGDDLHVELRHDDARLGVRAADALMDGFEAALAALGVDDLASLHRRLARARPARGGFSARRRDGPAVGADGGAP